MNNYKLFFSIVALMISSVLMSQTYEDVLRYSQPQYSGTARSVSMGGAFGSLGGDFSALGINPAGIATYRSSEFTFTPSFILNKTQSTLNGTSTDDDKNTLAFNQIGYVGTYRPMREVKKGIVSTHFSIGYNRNNNFNYKSMAYAANVQNSMADMFVINANGYSPEELSGLTMLAYESYIIDPEDPNADTYTYTNFLYSGDLVNQTRVIEKNGYAGEFNLTFGTNISNFLLLGGSLNFTSMNYDEESNYYEQYSDDNDDAAYDVFDRFSVTNYLNASGNGINLKAGFILKPIDGLRIGGAYHSPTWYHIEENYGSRIDGVFFNDIAAIGTNQTYAYYDGTYDYDFNTPEKMIASASYVLGRFAILSFDYEYIDYTKAKFKASTNSFDDIAFVNAQNDVIKETFTQTNNYRAGLEFRLNKQFSLRGGYALQESPYKDEPKDNEITSYSAGLGFRSNNYFFDIAYRLSSYETNTYNYDWSEDYDATYGTPPVTNTETDDHNIVVTFGVKF